MFELLAQVIALGIASTLSPIIFAISIAILMRKEKPISNLIFFLAGGVVTAILIAFAGFSLWNGDLGPGIGLAKYTRQFDIVLGVLFILFALSQFLPSKDPNERKMKLSGAGRLFALGLIVNITNFDAVLLNLTAVRVIFSANMPLIFEMLYVAFADLFFLAPALVPLVIFILKPEKTKEILQPITNLMQKYGRYLIAIIFLGLGLYLLLK